MTPFDNQVRLIVFQHLIDGRQITTQAIAQVLALPIVEIEAAFQRLADQHILVLKPGSYEIWMAMPFSAVPTSFQVIIGAQRWWANCIWDALGFAPMLNQTIQIKTDCADCGDNLTLDVAPDRLITLEGVVHFAIPARDWWQDIGYT